MDGVDPNPVPSRGAFHRNRFANSRTPPFVAQWPARPAEPRRPATNNLLPRTHLLAAVFALDAVCTALDALFREDKLRNEASIGQAALKVMQAHREVFELYYRLPSRVSKPGCGEINLLDYGQAG
jgi:hypothetical protein